jgi:hypothetical protein
MKVEIFIIVFAAFSAIGWIEFAKGFFPKAPTMAWRVLSLPVMLFMGLVFTYAPPFVQLAVAGLALMSLAYDNLIQLAKRLVDKLEGPPAAAGPGQ